METGIGSVIKNGNGSALVYTALLAAILANCIPSPADALYFRAQQRTKEKLEKGLITPTQYWRADVVGYYAYTAGYYAVLFGLFYATQGTYKSQTKILLALLSGGLVVGVVMNNIKKDNAIAEATKAQQAALSQNSGAFAQAPSLPNIKN